MINNKIPSSFKLRQTLQGHEASIFRISWSPDGKMLASPSADATIRVWDTETGELLLKLEGQHSYIYTVAWSPDGKMLASSSSDNTILIWEIATGKLIKKLQGHHDDIYRIIWSPDNQILASSSGDGYVCLWNINTWQLYERLSHTAPIVSIVLSPNGQLLASSTINGINLWDLSKKKTYIKLESFSDSPLLTLAWSSRNQILAAASNTGTIPIWNTETGKLIYIIEGHTDAINCVSFSHDGRILASKSQDNTVRLWDCNNWQNTAVLHEQSSNNLNSLAFHPQKYILATVNDDDKTVQLWDLNTDVLFHNVSLSSSINYINAKIIILGESGVGKSGLAIRIAEEEFRKTESTHGAQFWQIPISAKLNSFSKQNNIQAELTLWDLAGQPDYHLIHQLFLDDTDVALLLFDCSDTAEPFRGIPYWAKVLKKLAPVNALKYLVSARCDVSPVTVDIRDINRIIGEYSLDGYFQTSAKTGEGVEELLKQILAKIPWNKLPRTTTPKLFQVIRDFLLERKEAGDTLIDLERVKQEVEQRYTDRLPTAEEIDSVVGLLQGRGFVYRLTPTPKTPLVLLRPELINQFASSIIQAARKHPLGTGSIPERDVICAYLSVDNFAQEKYLPPIDEKLVLESTVELFIRHNLAFRELGRLVFPSQFNTPHRFVENIQPPTEVTYEFSGCIEAIYASLVVCISYTKDFQRENLWKDAAEFSVKGHRLGFSMKQVSEGTGELEIYFYPGVSDFDRVTFIRFITNHLYNKGIDIQERIRLYCPHPKCGKEITNREAIEIRVKAGKLDIACQYCDTSVLIPRSIEEKYRSDKRYSKKQRELNSTIETRIEKEIEAVKELYEVNRLYIPHSDKHIRILHLSDIHLVNMEQVKLYFTQLATDLSQNLNVKQLNYLLISGDITNHSAKEEYEAAFDLVDKLLKRYALGPSRLVIVPGNHDINWELSEAAYPFVSKRKLPKPLPEGRYIDAGDAGALIRDESEYKKRFKYFNDRFYKKIYDKPYPQEYDQQAIIHPCPEDKILFLALNSCWEIDHEYKNRAGIHPNAIANAIGQILEGNYDDWLKIAVWHHPVNGSESMKNVAFLEQLAVNGFQLGIHGHIHEAKDENFQYDTRRGLRIIAAGTFGAPAKEQVTGIPLQYNLLTLDPESGVMTVETRKKEKADGAWSADARWGDKNNPVPRYEINLQYGTGSKTNTPSNQPKASTQNNIPNPQQSVFGGNIQVMGNFTVGNITQNNHSSTINQATNPTESPNPKQIQVLQKPTFTEPRSLISELINTLNNIRFQGEEGEQGGTGSFYRYEIYLDNIIYEDEQNTGNNKEYKFTGSWSSFVYKYVYLFNKVVDTPWGHNKKPYGNFQFLVTTINGVLEPIRVKADRYSDSANNYAANKVEQLVESKIREMSIKIGNLLQDHNLIDINKRTILILASSPTNASRLRLDKEVREIDEGLRRAKQREQFSLQQRWAVRTNDLRRALLDFNPQIVHFCGHGSSDRGLVLENDVGNAQLVATNALASLFKLFAKEGVECVVLNACYAEVQALAISQHINYVVGMSDEISDDAALKFAVGFYDALGAGRSYEDAYEFGCNAIALEGIPEELTPVLKKKTINKG